jgi:hypothetical protein
MTIAKRLPSKFTDLEDLADDWAIATEPARRAKRQATTMPEINVFYERMTGRIGEILEYLNQFELAAMPAEAQSLMNMTLSLAEVGPAVEVYKQPTVIDGFPADRFA